MWIQESSPIPPSLMPPEPHIEINRGYLSNPPSNYVNQFKVTVRNQSHGSQKARLLGGESI